MTYQIVSTENKDSIYFIIIALSSEVKDPFQIIKIIFTSYTCVFPLVGLVFHNKNIKCYPMLNICCVPFCELEEFTFRVVFEMPN